MPRFNPLLPATEAGLIGLTLQYDVLGQRCLTRLPYKSNVPVSTPDLATFWANWKTACQTAVLGVLSNTCTFLGATVENLRDKTQNFFSGTPNGGNQLGTVVSPCPASQLSILTTRRSPTRGQHGRGYNFWPGIPASHYAAGLITAAADTAYNSLIAALLATITVGTEQWDLCVFQLSGPDPLPDVRAADVTSIIKGTRVTDRSTRKIGRGF